MLTVGLDEEEEVGVAVAPLAMNHVRLELRLELDLLRLDVPDQQDFVVGGLGDGIRVGGAPTQRSDVPVGEREQLDQLERLLVVDVHCEGRREGKLVVTARQDLLFPDLGARYCDFLSMASSLGLVSRPPESQIFPLTVCLIMLKNGA